MHPEEREHLRLSLLRFLDANATAHGLSASLLLAFARNEGRPRLTPDEVAAELGYLADKGLAAPAPKPISPENRAWRITAQGRDFLAERGL
jgi:hypothetical protein